MLRGNYKFGSVVTYRYLSPTANDRIPTVFIMTTRHKDGMVHGINLRYLTPLEQQQLQYYFKTPPEREQEKINPFQQQSFIDQKVEEQRQKQKEEYERKKQEYQEQQEGYVIKPKKGSIFGVSTFVKTKDIIVQKARAAFGKLSRYVPYGGTKSPPPMPEEPKIKTFTTSQPQQQLQNYNRQNLPFLDNPSAFYYSYVKPLLRHRTRNCYRRYKHNYINNERVIFLRR